MNIKRLLSFLTAGAMLFSVCGCTGSKKGSSTGSDVEAGSVDRNSLVAEGTSPVEEGLDLSGKTITYAIGLPLSGTMQKQLIAFQSKNNCKVETDLLGFQDYVQLLASRMAAGKVYDIIQLEGLRFPSIAIANFVEPLEKVITTADWSSDASSAGFNKEETSSFVWNKHLYAVVCSQGEFSSKPKILFYNKKIINEAGADDPRELYEKDKWNFDTFKEIGTKIVKKKGTYLCNVSFVRDIASWNGAGLIEFSDIENPKSNLTSSAYINAFNYTQKLTVGQNAVVPLYGAGDHTPEAFFEGKVAFHSGCAFDLYENHCIGEGVENSNAFDKSLNNLGIVAIPFGPDNTEKLYPVYSWLYGIAAGKGTSDPKIAMAFAKFSSAYSNINTIASYKYSDEDIKMINKLSSYSRLVKSHSFSDGSNVDNTLLNELEWKIVEGGDVAQLVSTYNAQIQNCIDVMMAQQ